MSSILRNTISKLYNAVSALMAEIRDALAERLQKVRETASLLYNRIMKNMKYGRERLKQKTSQKKKQQQEEEVLAAAKKQQQDDDEQYHTVAKIKLVYEGKRVTEFRVTGNLNGPSTKIIMANRAKVIYLF